MRILLFILALALSITTKMDSLVNANLLTVAQSLTMNELLSLSKANKFMRGLCRPVFEFTRVCHGLKNDSMLWPTLHLDFRVTITNKCLTHLKKYSYLFPKIRIKGGLSITRNVLTCIESLLTDIELVFNFWIQPQQLQLVLELVASRKLSLIMQDIDWNYDYSRIISAFLTDPRRNLIELVITEPIDNPLTRHVFDSVFSNVSNSKLTMFKFDKSLYSQGVSILCDSLVDGIRASRLEVFHLSGCDFEVESLELLGRSLPKTLRDLRISYMQFGIIQNSSPHPSPLPEVLLNILRLSLESLQLANFPFGFTTSAYSSLSDSLMSTSGSLRSVSFLNCDLRSDGIKSLTHALPYSKLVSLDLQKSISIEYLRLLGPLITSIGSISSLRILGLASNHLRYDGATRISSMLKHSKIQALDLRENQIDTFGAFRIAEGVKDSYLNTLDLSSNAIFKSGAVALQALNKEGNTVLIDFDTNPIHSDPGWLVRSLLYYYGY